MENLGKHGQIPWSNPSDQGDAPKEGFRAAGGGQRSPGSTGHLAGWMEKRGAKPNMELNAPAHGWFIRENTIKIDDLGVPATRPALVRSQLAM